MAATDKQRTQLVELLWQLKTELSRSGSQIHFSTLVNDPKYREGVLNNALQSGVPELQNIVRQIQALDAPGRLVPMPGAATDSSNKPTTPSRLMFDRALGANPPRRRSMASTALGIGATLLIVVMLAGGVAYFTVPGLLKPQGADIQSVSGSILTSTVWRSNITYILEDKVFVEGDATLTIEPGTRILGRFGSALIITRDAKLYARGRVDAPIVFTSAQPEGFRKRGDWGGLVLLGNAPLNQRRGHIEGIPPADVRGSFGGSDPMSNCGLLEYVRVEFAGFEIGANNELNGITLGGCGETTIVRYIQSHMGLDDGVEIFGGGVDIRYVVVSGAGDDGLDWDMGWTGNAQFVVIQQHPDDGDAAFEGDNWHEEPNAQPRSAPVIYNATLIGSRNKDKVQRAMSIRRGTAGTFRNFVVVGFPGAAIDIGGKETVELLKRGELSFENMLFHNIGAFGRTFFPEEIGPQNNDEGFNEEAFFMDPARNSLVYRVDPKLPFTAFDTRNPNFVPAADSPVSEGYAPVPAGGDIGGGEFWDRSATYLGAFRPNATNTWMDGWTAFPPN